MISALFVFDVEVESHIQLLRTKIQLPYCSCGISATRLMPLVLGRIAFNP